MSCYIIFLAIYPYLNALITQMSQTQLLRAVLYSSGLWIIGNYFYGSAFFPSSIILWVALYLLIAYLKIYEGKKMESTGCGVGLIAVGMIGYVMQVVATDWVAVRGGIEALSDKVLRWNANCSPFFIMTAIGALIIARKGTFRSAFINYLSGLSLSVYLIHENYLFRSYTRPYIWEYIYTNYGYQHVVLIDLAFAVILFVSAIAVSALYQLTVQKLVEALSSKIYFILSRLYGNVERKLLGTKS